VAGCATLEGGEGINLLSTEQERALGAKVSKEIEQQEKVLADPVIQDYVREIGERLTAQVGRTEVSYQFKVIDAPDTVNAFALPGGYMYVYTGLLKLCDTEAQLASVMGHEIAHVAAHHHGEAMTRAYGYQMVVDTLLGNNQRQLVQMAAGLAGTTGTLYFSRQSEREADVLGMRYLVQAGYPPNAMVRFMEKMMEASGGESQPPVFLSSHPATQERIQSLRQQAAQYPADVQARSDSYAARYQQIIGSRLGGAPSPTAPIAPAQENGWKVIREE